MTVEYQTLVGESVDPVYELIPIVEDIWWNFDWIELANVKVSLGVAFVNLYPDSTHGFCPFNDRAILLPTLNFSTAGV